MGDSEFARLTGLVRHAVEVVGAGVKERAREILDPACKQLVEELRQRCPDAFAAAALAAVEPIPPGHVAPPVTVDPKNAAALFTTAFAAAVKAPAAAPGSPAGVPSPVVWADGEHELLLYPAFVRLVLLDGLALVGIAVYTEQTGTVEVSVPFAVGSDAMPTGLMIATEPLPRGPALLVERWGDQLVAASWQALVRVAAGIAAAVGVDSAGQPLIPVALTAAIAGLTVLPQAAPIVSAAPPGNAPPGHGPTGPPAGAPA